MNNTITLRKAERHQVKLKIGLFGPTGSGKTYSALKLARGMSSAWDKVAIIDTENGSGDLYSNLGEYNIISLAPPFTPERYVEAIKAAEGAGMEVIVIDSVSQEWDGKGGLLDYVESLGGRVTDWAKATPRHRAFIQGILQSPCHIITTARTEQDYSIEKDSQGKTKVTKVGLKEIQRKGFDYEMTIAFQIDQNHLAKATKDRTGIFAPLPEFIIDESMGKTILEWNQTAPIQATAPEALERPEPTEIEKLKIEVAKEATRLGIDFKKPEFKDQIAAITGFELSQDKMDLVLAALQNLKPEDIVHVETIDMSDINEKLGPIEELPPTPPPTPPATPNASVAVEMPPYRAPEPQVAPVETPSLYEGRTEAWLKATIAARGYSLGVTNESGPDFQVAIESLAGIEWKPENLRAILEKLDVVIAERRE